MLGTAMAQMIFREMLIPVGIKSVIWLCCQTNRIAKLKPLHVAGVEAGQIGALLFKM
jgi:hypothetical protein